MEFSRQLLKHLPVLPPLEVRKTRCVTNLSQEKEPTLENPSPNTPPELELLQALTHEIRTPLTTIRTMTRLLLKRAKLTPEMTKCLEVIEQECNDQIDRMELIFRAAELETTPHQENSVQLVSTSLEQVFQVSIPRWQKQAKRRNVHLDFVLPKKLPQVVSDPSMLDQMLTGLIEKFTRSVSAGGGVRVEVATAGHQLKLQFCSQSNCPTNPLKALGQLLMFQPETGSLCLSLNVTKNLFNILGGKLIVRHHPQQGEVMTVYLPLGRGKL
jgi:signal transduction histidine kinase